MEPRQRRCVPCPGVWTPRGSGLPRVPLRTSPPRPCRGAWWEQIPAVLLEMLSVKPRRKDGDGVALLPEEGQWPHVEDCVGSGTLCLQPALGPPTHGDLAAAGPAPELERDVRAGATQRQAMGRGWHVTWPIRMGFPPLGARTFAPKACADASSPLCALTWISLSSFTCDSARGRSCGGPWPRPQSRRRARQEWAPRASDRLHTVSATMSPVCREHRAAPSTPCPRAVLPTSQRDPHLEGQFHLDGERSRGAVRPPGPCTTLGRREGCSRGSLDEDTEARSGHRAPTGREAVTDNSAQTPKPGFGPRATARCPPARWHG